MRKLVFIIIILPFIACHHKPDAKAVALVKKANQLGLESQYNDTIKANEALKLLDEAIAIDDQYFSAYYSKSMFLAVKKDIDGELLNNAKLIELRPNQPMWLIQRGLYYDIKGDKKKATENYDLGISKYKKLLKNEKSKQDFNLRLEYISALEAKEDFNQIKIEIQQMKNDFPSNEIVTAFLKDYKSKTKAELIDLWKNGKQNATVTININPH